MPWASARVFRGQGDGHLSAGKAAYKADSGESGDGSQWSQLLVTTC